MLQDDHGGKICAEVISVQKDLSKILIVPLGAVLLYNTEAILREAQSAHNSATDLLATLSEIP
jgi:hypothetical protein